MPGDLRNAPSDCPISGWGGVAPRSLHIRADIADGDVMERKSTTLVRGGCGNGRKAAGLIVGVDGDEDHNSRQSAFGAPIHEALIDRPQAVLDGRNAIQHVVMRTAKTLAYLGERGNPERWKK